MEDKPADWDEHYEWPYDRTRRICMKILGDPNPVVRALGLDIVLPDPDASDAAKWGIDPGAWKAALRGRIADPWEQGDTGWALLMAPEWGRVWFDLAEGVIVYFPVERIDEATMLVSRLRMHGVSLVFADGTPRVQIAPVSLGADVVSEIERQIEIAGFEPGPHRRYWTPANLESPIPAN